MASAAAAADQQRELQMLKKDYEKKLKAQEKKIDTLEKKLKAVQGTTAG